jgi:ribosomal protein S4
MSNTGYKPRLKGVLRNKKFILTAKNLQKLTKKKWLLFLNASVKTLFLAPLIRNDVFLVDRTSDLRREYGRVLSCKRQAVSFFGTLRKRVLRHAFSKSPGSSFLGSFLGLVENRLDVLVFRSNFAKSFYQSRWLIASGFVSINTKTVRILSYRLSVGDFIQLTKSFFTKSFLFNTSTFTLPSTSLEVNYETFSLIVVSSPQQLTKEAPKLYPFFLFGEDMIASNKIN